MTPIRSIPSLLFTIAHRRQVDGIRRGLEHADADVVDAFADPEVPVEQQRALAESRARFTAVLERCQAKVPARINLVVSQEDVEANRDAVRGVLVAYFLDDDRSTDQQFADRIGNGYRREYVNRRRKAVHALHDPDVCAAIEAHVAAAKALGADACDESEWTLSELERLHVQVWPKTLKALVERLNESVHASTSCK